MKRRLKKEKILIILDDIWKEIQVDLEEIGIPASSSSVNQCKIVLITCSSTKDGEEYLCKEKYTGTQICFAVESLPSEEALTLFNKTITAGLEKNIPEEVRSIATRIVEECCEGLPIAIVAIAKEVLINKDETDQLSVWKNAMEHLIMNGNSAAACLEWCYNTHLKDDDDAKSLLLLCASLSFSSYGYGYGYGGGISMYHLLQYAMGLDLLGPIYSLDQARNRLLELVEFLKASGWLIEYHRPAQCSSSLFGDADQKKFVRMHNVVVYDVVREIASKDPHHPFVVLRDLEDAVGLEEWSKTDESKRCTFLSLHCNRDDHDDDKEDDEDDEDDDDDDDDDSSKCSLNMNIPIPETFFKGMKNLQVLDMSGMGFITTLPSSLVDSLANLRTLRLDGCNNLVDIVGIGKLTKLQVLSLVGSSIRQLPNEMVHLTYLRLLDLNDCDELEVIPQNVLSRLSRLECLFMIDACYKWAAPVEGDHQSNNAACLSELNHLSCLHIDIADAKEIPKDIQFENLTRYAICIGYPRWKSRRTDRTLKLENVNMSLDLGDGLRKLLERSEELQFDNLSGTNYVLQYYPSSNRESFAKLKHLQVESSDEIQYIIDSLILNQGDLEHGAAFPLLESLVLKWMEGLEEVWHGRPIPRGSFSNLKTLEVSECHNLRYLFSLSIARDLSQLEDMRVEDCNAMEQIITYENGEGGTNWELFPNLRTLKLRELPELINFCSESQTISSTRLNTNARPEDSTFNYKVSSSKLEKLELYYVPKLKDAWNSQGPFGSLSNIRTLRVQPDASNFMKRRRRRYGW